MKSLASLAVVGTVAVVAIFGLNSNQSSNASTFLAEDNDQEVKQLFNEFISEHQRNFLTKEEYNARLGNFKANLAEINRINAEANNTFTLEINQFADLSQEEYERQIGLKDLLEPEDAEYYEREFSIPFDEEEENSEED